MAEKRKVEVLAPAGSYESMEAAVAAGADAVYIGGSRFGARAYADNPDEEMLCRAIDYAHLHGCRLYMTVNTLFKEQELRELPEYLLPYYRRGLDAVIVQDLGAMALIRQYFPEIPIHASTQMTITGVYGAKMLKELGASRVVTARELSLEEIRRIHHQVDVEIESFVHGALCYCYSGQCLMSSLIGGRSGNRGRCAQPCRLPYEVWQKGKKLNKKQDAYVLSMKDLCTLDLLPDILEAGVHSLKIEGRMKNPRYTAGVTSVYRKYVDRYMACGREGYQVEAKDKQMLLDLFDRGGFTQGYYTQHNGKTMLALKEKPAFREVDPQLLAEIDQKWVKKKLQEPIAGSLILTPGKAAKLCLVKSIKNKENENAQNIQAEVLGQEVLAAQKQPMTRESISRQLKKTGNTPFYFSKLEIELNGDVFLPLQALNELRRNGLEKLENQVLSAFFREVNTDKRCELQEFGNTEKEDSWCFERIEKENDGLCSGKIEREDGLCSGKIEREDSLCLGNIEKEEDGSCTGNIEKEDDRLCLENAERKKEHQHLENTEKKNPYFVVSVEEIHQLSPVLLREEVKEIYLDADGFGAEVWRETVDDCHKKKKKCFLLMPEIFRREAVLYFAQNQSLLSAAGFDGFVVRNLEEVEWARMQGQKQTNPQGKTPFFLIFDAALYSWNSLSIRAMKQVGADRLSVPAELNARELQKRGAAGQEILIYGRLPMMVSAQCVQKTVQGCSRKREELRLKDRMGKEMPVKNRCRFCYNTIYNASPLSLLGQERLVEELNPASLRLHFTNETQGEAEKLLAAFIDSFSYHQPTDFPLSAFTRGHMKRGVE